MRHILKAIVAFQVFLLTCPEADAQVKLRATDTVNKPNPIVIVQPVKGPKPITNELSVGFRLNTDGWSVYTDIGKVKSKDPRHIDMFHNVRFWQIEVTEKKNPKEYKSTSDNGGGTNTYIYGKINNLYALKLGWGYRRLLVGKPDPGSVSIHWANVLGLSVGFLKPYYLNTVSDPDAIKYSDANKMDFLNQSYIEGSAGFSKGLSEVKIVPGGHFKSSVHFDFSANRKDVIGVETGFNLEYYSQQVQLMANQPSTAFFADLFIAIQFGRRW